MIEYNKSNIIIEHIGPWDRSGWEISCKGKPYMQKELLYKESPYMKQLILKGNAL